MTTGLGKPVGGDRNHLSDHERIVEVLERHEQALRAMVAVLLVVACVAVVALVLVTT